MQLTPRDLNEIGNYYAQSGKTGALERAEVYRNFARQMVAQGIDHVSVSSLYPSLSEEDLRIVEQSIVSIINLVRERGKSCVRS